MRLTETDISILSGELGAGPAIAMDLLVRTAPAMGADSLLDVTGSHIDGCLYHGKAGLDFARLLEGAGARVRVPTTLNVSSLDLLHPTLYRGDEETALAARELMNSYVAMGCSPTWTCAPYQSEVRPGLGEQIAWGESNAIVFANSVLGARTNRYGDFLDICCAITGRAPRSGLHTDEGRRAGFVVEVRVPDRALDAELLYPLLGHLVGQVAGTEIPAIVGLDQRATEDRLKALGAAAASSGTVAMFHAVGVTPEAPTLDAALGGRQATRLVTIGPDDLDSARRALGERSGPLGAVSVGTPHASLSEIEELAALAAGDRSKVPFYLNTSREVLARAERLGLIDPIEAFGVTVVTDTCNYITPIMTPVAGVVMTNSAKWAYYAPGNLGVAATLGSVAECVESAREGRVIVGEGW